MDPKISDDDISENDAVDFLSETEEVGKNGLSAAAEEEPPSAPEAGTSGKNSKQLSDAELDEFLKGF